jgi:hypothetical protein
MRARLAALVAAVAVVLAIAPMHPVGTTFADPVCPFGTNWDNSIHACR